MKSREGHTACASTLLNKLFFSSLFSVPVDGAFVIAAWSPVTQKKGGGGRKKKACIIRRCLLYPSIDVRGEYSLFTIILQIHNLAI